MALKLAGIISRSRRWWMIGWMLSLMVLAACQPQAVKPPTVDNAIQYGETVQGKLSDGESRWLFVGTQDDVIAIDFTTASAFPTVAILGPNGDSVARVSPETGRLERFRLTATGKYTIVVGAGSGNYTLALRQIASGDETPTAPPTPPLIPLTQKTITIGQTIPGTLNAATDQDLWAYSGQQGAIISIRATGVSPDFTPTLRLFLPDGTLLASDDNVRSERDLLLGGITLPITGTYLIRVSGSGHTGGYNLTIQAGAPTPTITPSAIAPLPTIGPTPTASLTLAVISQIQSGAQLRIGQAAQGVISSPDQVDHFAVFGAAGTVISVGMFAAPGSSLNPSFIMYAPDGEQVGLAAGDDAVISGYMLPASGAYVIYAHGVRSETTGAYTLEVGSGLTLRDIGGDLITPGTTVTGQLSQTGDREIWALDLPASAIISLVVTSSEPQLNPVVQIIGPDGKTFFSGQANPQTHSVEIPSITTALAGRYHIQVSAAQTGSTGAYTLNADVLRIVPTATFSINIDQTFQEDIDVGQRFTYSFKGLPGEIVFVEAHARAVNGFDPVIDLIGPSGKRLAEADDISLDNTDALLQTALDDGPGTYTIQVYGYAFTPGAFSVHIRAS